MGWGMSLHTMGGVRKSMYLAIPAWEGLIEERHGYKNGSVEKILRPSERVPSDICVPISDKAVIYGLEDADASRPCSLCR